MFNSDIKYNKKIRAYESLSIRGNRKHIIKSRIIIRRQSFFLCGKIEI